MQIRRCAWCKGRVRWDDRLRNDIQINAADAAPHQIQFIIELWGTMPEGTVQGGCCRKCHAKLLGEPEPLPIRYGPDNPQPDGIVGDDKNCSAAFPVCGICRLALYEGDGTTPIRLYPEDLDLPDGVWQNVQTLLAAGKKPEAHTICKAYDVPIPGAPQGCPECLAKYKPRVLARLHAAGQFLEVTDPRRMGRGLLL